MDIISVFSKFEENCTCSFSRLRILTLIEVLGSLLALKT